MSGPRQTTPQIAWDTESMALVLTAAQAPRDGNSLLLTAVRVVYRTCLLPRGGDLPHVARRLAAFLSDLSPDWTLAAVYERTESLHCMQLLAAREPTEMVEPLYRVWVFSEAAALAAKRGDVETLAWLASSYLPDAFLSTAAATAAANGQLHVLQWLHEVHYGRVHWGGTEWCGAIREGRVDVIEWLKTHAAIHPDALPRVTLAVAEAGDLSTLQWLQNEYGLAVDAALRGAHEGHQWSVVKWLVIHCNVTPTAASFAAAASDGDGDLPFLQWLHASGWASPSRRSIPIAASNGHLEVIQWIYGEIGEQELDADAMVAAARGGHLEVVKWLDAHECPASADAMDDAATNGFLEVVRWLHVNRTEGCTSRAMNGAAENGHLQVIQWLHNMRREGCTVSAMEKAAGNGHLGVVRWLHEHRSEGCTERAMDWAAERGHLDVVKWLHVNRIEGCTTDAMDWAASFGHFDVVEWLHMNRSEGCTVRAMNCAAGYGHLNVMKWLHTNRTEGFTSSAIDMAAANGHLDVLMWLHGNGTELCTPSAVSDAVLHGHFPVVLFLYQKYGRKYCEEGLHMLSEGWEDAELPFVGLAQWLMETFGKQVKGARFVVNRADWSSNDWLRGQNMRVLDLEEKSVCWECGPNGTQSDANVIQSDGKDTRSDKYRPA
ncbi:hypothetical protein BBJ28_00017401, partial [Nothophytophthora sp. Chile5]